MGLSLKDFEQKNLLETFTLAERDIFDACRAIEKAAVIKFFGTQHDKMQVIREKQDGSTRLWVKILNPQQPDRSKPGWYFEHSAQPDVIFVAGDLALIAEYKTLAGDVAESSENLQLRDQVVLFKGYHPEVRRVGAVVIQPFVTHDPQITAYTAETIEKAEGEMFERVLASNDPRSRRIAGEKQCQWCLAKTKCLEYNRWAGGMVPGMLSILDVAVDAWTPQHCKAFLDNRLIAQKWLDNCELAIKQRLEKDPEAVDGWKLKAGAKVEKIVDPQTVFERFNKLGGKLEQFMGCIAVGKGKLQKALYDVTGAKGKSLDAAWKTITNGCIQESVKAPSLVRSDESATSSEE